MRGCAGGLLKESPTPPRTFLERIIIGGSRRSRPVPAFACVPAWRRWLSLPLWCPRGGLPCWSPAAPAFSLLFCPHPPGPLPGGKGGTQSLFRRGLRPRHPGIKPPAALTDLAKQVPGATESLRFNAKPTERFPYEQCRQPRRGGTGGEELRRLRWSSPPGQGEQVPPGFNPGDARGEAPCIRKLKISPFPPGRGAGGWGQ